MKTTLTKDDVPKWAGASIELGEGYALKVDTEYDEGMGPPWEEHEGHGPVSDWVSRDKRPGERLLHNDRGSKRYYDIEAATELARKDGWGLSDEKIALLTSGMCRAPTAGEIRAAAVESDFDLMRGWVDDEWHWVGVVVKLIGPDDEEIADSSLWGIEDNSDYWREIAAELGEGLIAEHLKETAEAGYWAARGVLTV